MHDDHDPSAGLTRGSLMQHATLGLFKEMLFTLDLAQQAGTKADRLAAERLQHRYGVACTPLIWGRTYVEEPGDFCIMH